MSSAIAMNLHNLPTDLIRKIIQVGQEHIDFMRTVSCPWIAFNSFPFFLPYLIYSIPWKITIQISRRWNILSIEHLSDRKRLPQIKSLMWHTSGRGIIIKMYIPNKRCRFFGVRNWSSLTTSLSESEGVSQCWQIREWQRFVKNQKIRPFACFLVCLLEQITFDIRKRSSAS